MLAGKTGFTNRAGYCYVAALESEGRTFIIALLGCGWPNNRGYKWKDAIKLFTYGCDKYELKEIRRETNASEQVNGRRIPVENGYSNTFGETVFANVRLRENIGNIKVLVGKEETIHAQIEGPVTLMAPIFQNTKVGEVKYYVGDQYLFSDDIETISNVETVEFWRYLTSCFERFLVD